MFTVDVIVSKHLFIWLHKCLHNQVISPVVAYFGNFYWKVCSLVTTLLIMHAHKMCETGILLNEHAQYKRGLGCPRNGTRKTFQ